LALWSTGKPYLERWMRERAGPRHQLQNLPPHPERIPPSPETTDRPLDTIPPQGHQGPNWRSRSEAFAPRLIGVALVAVGANSLGTDTSLWVQTQPMYWLLLAAGAWLVLRRAGPDPKRQTGRPR